jgi:hypothetical protein
MMWAHGWLSRRTRESAALEEVALRRGIAGAKGEQIVGRFGGGAGGRDNGAVVLTQHLEPGGEIISVPHGRHDRESGADERAGHFRNQLFTGVSG